MRWPSSRSSAMLPLNFERHEAPCRRASSSTTIEPTLCRVRSYSRPGLPSPTTSRSSDEARSPRRHPAHIEVEVFGHLHRERLDVHLARDLRKRTALANAWGVLGAD